MEENHDDHQLLYRSTSTVHFQMPHFVLGGTPSLAHGGGAEVLPGMYGQGPQAWTEYDKYWYDQSHQPGLSKEYMPSELVVDPPSSTASAGRVHMTPRPFEFDPPPAVAPPSPGMQTIEVSGGRDMVPSADFVQDRPHLTFSNPQTVPIYSFPSPNFLDPTAPLPPLPANGLPLYSASGFDMLRMLAKVATRPNPRIMLGPVDMTCSFVVVDVRRLDSPIVYASPTFTRLTGYSEAEVLGRNCRFLQHPSGQLQRGDPRQFTAPDAVRHLHKSLLQDKECQASLINYRRDGSAFINLITVIPISAPEDERDGESGEITHCVGFQVDLAEQPNAILQKLRDGSYIVNYSSAGVGPDGLPGPGYGILPGMSGAGMGRDRRGKGVSVEMIELLRKARAYPGTRPGEVSEVGVKGARDSDRAELHALLLENTDDFIHVVSLKGSLLYVAPAITRVLGYNPAELVGKSIADLCHPADVVPLMRELKDASSIPPSHVTVTPASSHHTHASIPAHAHASLFMLPSPHPSPPPKPVNLLFRALHKTSGGYVWLEARGRLHVEQGKGRKAIVLVGRRVDAPKLTWGALELAQSLESAVKYDRGIVDDDGGSGDVQSEVECWGLVSPTGLVLSASPTGAHRLGFATSSTPHIPGPGDPQSLVGRSLASLIIPGDSGRVGEMLAVAAYLDRAEVKRVRCRMQLCPHVPAQGNMTEAPCGTDVESVPVEIRFFAQERERQDSAEEMKGAPSLPPSLVFQIIFLDAPDIGDSNPSLSPTSCPINSSPDTTYTVRSVAQSSVSPPERNISTTSFMDATRSLSAFPLTRKRRHTRARARSPRLANANILAELDTSVASASASPSSSSETSWQYELTRLRFENERMREEVGKLEHIRRGLALTRGSMSHTRKRTGGGGDAAAARSGLAEGATEFVRGGASPVMSSLNHPPPLPHPHMMSVPLPPSRPQKRTSDGQLKLPPI